MNRPAPVFRLAEALRSGLPVVTCEIASGDGADAGDIVRRAHLVRDHVDAVNVPDNTAGIVHLSALAASALLVRAGVDPVMHVTCRDRNRLALQSDLLGAGALGVRNVLCLTGDHMIHGDQPDAKPVFDLDSLQLLVLANVLRGGRYLSGRVIAPAPVRAALRLPSPAPDEEDRGGRPVHPDADHLQRGPFRGVHGGGARSRVGSPGPDPGGRRAAALGARGALPAGARARHGGAGRDRAPHGTGRARPDTPRGRGDPNLRRDHRSAPRHQGSCRVPPDAHPLGGGGGRDRLARASPAGARLPPRTFRCRGGG